MSTSSIQNGYLRIRGRLACLAVGSFRCAQFKAVGKVERRNISHWRGAKLGAFAGVAVLSLSVSLPATERVLEVADVEDFVPSLSEAGPPQAAQINGARMWLSSAVTSRSPSEVLDGFESSCQPHFSAKFIGKDDVGHLACLRRADGPSQGSFWSELWSMASGDAAFQLGRMLYVVARRAVGTEGTHVLVVWTEERFNLLGMFPAKDDVPGGDSELVPRPVASKRVLSARLVDRPYAVHVYESRASVVEVLEFYEKALSTRGFSRIEASGIPGSRGFKREGGSVIVTTSVTPVGFVRVSLVELGEPSYVTTTKWEAP